MCLWNELQHLFNHNNYMKNKRIYKERHVYFGICINGDHEFQSYKKTRIKNGLCRIHRKGGLSKDQIPMFQPGGEA